MKPLKKVAICVVTYKSADLTIDCLASIEPEIAQLPGSRVIVVDNGSKDGSEAKIRAAIAERGWSAWTEFLEAAENRGYAAGNNLAMRHDLKSPAPADYYLLLNPDTIVRPGAIRVLLEFMEKHPEAGIAGSRSEDADGTPQDCCFRFPGILAEFANYLRLGFVDRLLSRFITRVPVAGEAHAIGWVSGASMIIRRQVIDDIGLFDDNYFLYYEETDFILRAKRAGWSCWHVPESRVIHLVGHSTGVKVQGYRAQPLRRPSYWFASRRRYFKKNYGFFYAAAVDLAAMFGLFLWQIRKAVEKKPDFDPPHFFRDLIRQSVLFKCTRT